MNGPVLSTTGSEFRLVKVLDDYLAAEQRGDAPDKSALLAAHPDLADDLQACLASLDFIRRAATTGPNEPSVGIPFEAEPPTGRLGDFRIIREAGRGGMGVVYEAEQVSLGRRVALKVLPFAAALDPRQLARFRVEAQAAAQLHHTNIVPVFSVGVERGVHYYAMQFIEGRSLAEVIRELRQARDPAPASDPGRAGSEPPDRTPLGTTPNATASGRPFFQAVARLGVQAAEALEFAHSLGIVHRDVKPANLLLDARGTLWVTDFGLARLHDDAGLTMTGDVLGTLRYMSPEQALANRVMIDQRTDVYSLGVTLYELLTLRPAFVGRDRQELLRQIAFEEPPPPRRVDPAIPRELETVVLKAMAKEPESRYASAQELADDLRRFLEHRPIKARRPPLMERAAKWSRRHPTAVGAAALVLLIGVAGLTVSNRMIARRNAEVVRQRDEIKRALKESEEARRQAEEVGKFLVSAFRKPDPSEDGKVVKVVDVLDQAAAKLDDEFAGAPKIKGELLDTLAETYLGLGLPEKSVVLHEKAFAIWRELHGPDHGETLFARNRLAVAYLSAGRFAECLPMLEETLPLAKAKLGLDHPTTLDCMNNLAASYDAAGRRSESVRLYEEALPLAKARLGPDHPLTLATRNNLAETYSASGRADEAMDLFEGTLQLCEAKLGPDHPDTLTSRNNLAAAYWKAGRLDRSVPLFELTLKQKTAKLGPDHPDTLFTQANLGLNYRDAGNPAEGARSMAEALRRARGRPHVLAALAWVPKQLAEAYAAAGQFDRSESLSREGLEHARKSFGPDDSRTAASMAQLALSLLKQEKWSVAEPVLRECLAVRANTQPDAWGTFNTRSQLGGSLLGQKKYAEAEPLIVSGYEGMSARKATIPPQGTPRLTEAAERLVRLYELWGRPDEAAAWKARLGLADREAKMPNGAAAFAH